MDFSDRKHWVMNVKIWWEFCYLSTIYKVDTSIRVIKGLYVIKLQVCDICENYVSDSFIICNQL